MTCCGASLTACNAAWHATGEPCCGLCEHYPGPDRHP